MIKWIPPMESVKPQNGIVFKISSWIPLILPAETPGSTPPIQRVISLSIALGRWRFFIIKTPCSPLFLHRDNVRLEEKVHAQLRRDPHQAPVPWTWKYSSSSNFEPVNSFLAWPLWESIQRWVVREGKEEEEESEEEGPEEALGHS